MGTKHSKLKKKNSKLNNDNNNRNNYKIIDIQHRRRSSIDFEHFRKTLTQPPRNYRMLVVDDNEINRKFNRKRISRN